jgi:hypothetical protein
MRRKMTDITAPPPSQAFVFLEESFETIDDHYVDRHEVEEEGYD